MLELKKLFGDEQLKRLAAMAKRRVEEAQDSNVEKVKRMKFYKTDRMTKLTLTDSEKQSRYQYVAPIFHIAHETWVAGAMGAMRTNPLISIKGKGGTQKEAVDALQKVIDWNVEETKHISVLSRGLRDSFQAGLGILKRVSEFRPYSEPVPVQGEFGEIITQIQTKLGWNDYTYRVNPCNYLQDTTATGNDAYRDKCSWAGEAMLKDVLALTALKEKEGAIADNIDAAIKKAKEKSKPSMERYYKETISDADVDYDMKTVVYELYGYWPIKGNEDDRRMLMVILDESTDKILQIKQVYDHPYTLIRPRIKNDMYLGTAPAESVVPSNMLVTLLTNAGIENCVNNMKRFFAVMKGSGVSAKDLQSLPNGGFLNVDLRAAGVQQISQIFQEFQGRDTNVQHFQALLAMFNDFAQKSTSQSDLLTYGVKPSFGGGLNHAGYTATGANLVDQNMKTSVADIMNNVGLEHESHWDKKIFAIQELMPDYQMIEIAGEDPVMIRKATTVGNFKADAVSGIITNKVSSLQALTNVFPFMSQLATAAAGAGQQFNADFNEMLRTMADLADLPNKERLFPTQLPVNLGTQPPQAPNQSGGQVAPGNTAQPNPMAVTE